MVPYFLFPDSYFLPPHFSSLTPLRGDSLRKQQVLEPWESSQYCLRTGVLASGTGKVFAEGTPKLHGSHLIAD